MSNNDRRSHENLTLDAFPRFELFFFSGLGSSAVEYMHEFEYVYEYEYEYECSCLQLLLCFMLISFDCSVFFAVFN